MAGSSYFTPFGGGQRLCPGVDLARLEASIFLHHLVTSFRYANVLLINSLKICCLRYLLAPMQLGGRGGHRCQLPHGAAQARNAHQSHAQDIGTATPDTSIRIRLA
jgi:hypothetical protein